MPVDFAANAASWGACAVRVRSRKEFEDALAAHARERRTTVIVAEVEKEMRVRVRILVGRAGRRSLRDGNRAGGPRRSTK